MIGAGIFLIIKGLKFKSNAVEITGEVVAREVSGRVGDDRDVDVYVAFEYNGKKYDYVRLSEEPRKYEGEKITLYIDPEDPTNVKTSTVPVAGILLIPFGAVVMLFGFMDISRMIKKGKTTDKSIIKNGIRITAKIDYIGYDSRIRVNGRTPRMLKCSYTDETTGRLYAFSSESVFDNLDSYYKPGDPVFVYVMPEDYNKYSVDIDSYQKMGGPIVVDYTK